MRNRKGITLVEVILTLALVALVIPVVYSVFFAGSTSHSISTSKGFAQQNIRMAADILTSELRFVTDISNVGYASSEYYSLKINNDGNLVKTKHVHQVDDSVEKTTLWSIPGNWTSINVTNSESGVIDVKMEQVEQTGSREARFELTMAITTENSPNMISNVNLELVNGEVLYYRNTKMRSLSHSIYLSKPDEIGGDLVTVRFYRNDGTDTLHAIITGKSGTTKNLPANPGRGGYSFTSWNTSEGGDGTSYGSGSATTFTMPSNDTDLYAIWATPGVLARVTIDTSAGTDGVVLIDGIAPRRDNDNRFIVRKANDNPAGSDVKIKLLGYTSSHAGKVTVTVGNSTTAVEADGSVTFSAVAGSTGANRSFSVEITIKTDGQDYDFKKVYNFITS